VAPDRGPSKPKSTRHEIVTSEEVLTEFLACFSNQGRPAHETATRSTDRILANPDIVVRPQTHQIFLEGYALYKARPDKGYSLRSLHHRGGEPRAGLPRKWLDGPRWKVTGGFT
jgi:hypothetical protein